jgi:hypothetical protein
MEEDNFITLLADDRSFFIGERLIRNKPGSYLDKCVPVNLVKYSKIRFDMFPEELEILIQYHRNEKLFKPLMTEARYRYILEKYNLDVVDYKNCIKKDADKVMSMTVDEFLKKIAIILVEPKKDDVNLTNLYNYNWIFTLNNEINWNALNMYYIFDNGIRKRLFDKIFNGNDFIYLNHKVKVSNFAQNDYVIDRNLIVRKKYIIDNKTGELSVCDTMSIKGDFYNNVVPISENVVYSSDKDILGKLI